MNIAKRTVVTIHYTLRDDSGVVIDSSPEGEPLAYLHGTGDLLPSLDAALEGKSKGDSFKLTLTPKEGYGERDENLVQRIPKDQFPDPSRLTAGQRFQIVGPKGPMILTVTQVSAADVVVDGNHELAGKALHFEVQVTDVRQATAEELEHGHVHGPGGHHHGH